MHIYIYFILQTAYVANWDAHNKRKLASVYSRHEMNDDISVVRIDGVVFRELQLLS